MPYTRFPLSTLLCAGYSVKLIFYLFLLIDRILIRYKSLFHFTAYLNVSDINIIVVDWGTAANVNYILASYNVAMVGRVLTEFLNFLISEGVSMDDVHLIGHSLGAHVVGIAGAYVKRGPIDTITGWYFDLKKI